MLNDIRYGIRALRRNPAVTITAVVALALGISSNTAEFSIADAFLFKPLALRDPDRLVMLPETRGTRPIAGTSNVSPANFEDWKRQATSFEQLAASQLLNINITGQGEPEGLLGSRVSPGLFETLGARQLIGRVFQPDEDQLGRDQVAVLSFGLWERRFASDPDIVGKTVRLDGKPFTVVGIMPKNFHFPLPAEIWTPMAMDDKERAVRGARYMDVVGRLKPGISAEQAAAEMRTISKRLSDAYPETNRGWTVRLMPIRDFLLGDLTRSYTLMTLAAVGFVLLIACANVANLQFARTTFRGKEIAVRTALGAGRWRIVRLLVVESVLLGLAGAAVGILLAQWDVDMIRSHMPAEIARFVSGWDQIRIDGRALLFTALVAILAGIVSGLAPALQNSKPDLNEALKESVRGSSEGRSRSRLRGVLLTGEIALALVLLVGAGLMVKGVHGLISVNENLAPQSLLTMRISLPESKYKEPRQMAAFYHQALAGLATLPHVEAATLATSVPYGNLDSTSRLTIEGRPAEAGELRLAQNQVISPNYFTTMRVALRDGRAFSEHDGTDSQPVAIVSENLARRYWPGSTALGRKIKLGAEDAPWLTVVGVVQDVRYDWFDASPKPAVYRSIHADRPAVRVSGAAHDGRSTCPCRRRAASHRRPRRRASGVRSENVGKGDLGIRPRPFLRRGDDDGAGRDRAGAGLRGSVRRDVLRGVGAHPRDRDSPGNGRGAKRRAAHGDWAWDGGDGDRTDDRVRAFSDAGALAGQFPFWRECDGLADLRGNFNGAGRGGDSRLLYSSAAGDEDRSGGGFAI